MKWSEILTISISIFGGAMGVYVGLRERLTRVETKVDTLIRDIDRIAEFVGTPRAKARKLKNQSEENSQ